MPEIVEGRRYTYDEAARVIGVTAGAIEQVLFTLRPAPAGTASAAHEITADELQHVWKVLKPYVLIGIPDAGRVTADEETALRQLWRELGAVCTPSSVQFRCSTEAEAKEAITRLPAKPGFTWSYLRIEPGQSGCEAYVASGKQEH